MADINHARKRLACHILLTGSNLLLLAFVLILAACSRLSTDDFSMLASLRAKHNVFSATAWWWTHWTGRVVAIGLSVLVSGIAKSDGKVLGYCLVTFGAFVLSVYSVGSVILKHRLGIVLPTWTRANAAVLISGLALFASLDRGEVWFWLSGSVVYLWPMSLALMGASLLLDRNTGGRKTLAAAVLFALACGCSESLGMLIVVSLCIGALADLKRSSASWNRWPRLADCHRLLGPLSGAGAMMALVYAAPGNHIRLKGAHVDITLALLHWPAFALHVVAFLLLHRLPWFLGAVGVGYAIGACVDSQNTNWQPPQVGKWLLGSLLVLTAALFLSVLPALLVFQQEPPLRTWFPATIILLLICGNIGFVLAGYTVFGRRKWIGTEVIALCLVANMLLTVRYMRQQIPIVVSYSRAYDARYRIVLREKELGRISELTVIRLPSSPDRWINTYDITDDPSHWINQVFKAALELPFDVRLGP